MHHLVQSIRITGRFSGDAPGQMTIAERQIFAGTGSQTSTANRWGDYTSSKIEEDEMTTISLLCKELLLSHKDILEILFRFILYQ